MIKKYQRPLNNEYNSLLTNYHQYERVNNVFLDLFFGIVFESFCY